MKDYKVPVSRPNLRFVALVITFTVCLLGLTSWMSQRDEAAKREALHDAEQFRILVASCPPYLPDSSPLRHVTLRMRADGHAVLDTCYQPGTPTAALKWLREHRRSQALIAKAEQ
jgi:hypothetical protein